MKPHRFAIAMVFAWLVPGGPLFAVPLNEQPMYGNQARTPEMLAADQKLIASAADYGWTRAQASDHSVQLG